MKYSDSTGGIYHPGFHSDIPEDARDISEQEYANIVSTPRPPASPQTPSSVSMFQARVALQRAGLLDQVQTALDAMPAGQGKNEAKMAWEWAAAVERGSPFVALFADALGLDDAAVDELFQAAYLVR